MKMEDVCYDAEKVISCNYCGHDGVRLYMRSTRPKWFNNKPLELVECTKCGLVRALYRPLREQVYRELLEGGEEARQYFERKKNRKNVMDVHRRHIRLALNTLRQLEAGATITTLGRINQLEERGASDELEGKGVKLFDMGFGAGTTLDAAAEMGMEPSGNEINAYAVSQMKKKGYDVYLGFTRDLDLPENRYDIVLNFDYIEHTYEPFDDLRTCYRILRPGGLLYLKTLYLDCPDHILKKDGYQLFGLGHYYYYPVRTLLSMIYKAGFDIVNLRLGQLVFVMARKNEEACPEKRDSFYYHFRVIDDCSYLPRTANSVIEQH